MEEEAMSLIPTIRPISELKNTTSISILCHEVKAPVFITKNGYSDLVIMSIDTYKRNMAMLEFYRKLNEAEEQFELRLPTKSHKEIIFNMRNKTAKKSRDSMFGCLRGEYKIADDFDAPLEDFREYME